MEIDERASLRLQLNKARAKYNRRRAELLNEKNRLRSAYNSLTTLREQFHRAQEDEERVSQMNSLWRGQCKTKVMQQINSAISDEKRYYRKLDQAHDLINRKLTQVEQELSGRTGILGSIQNTINWLLMELQNLTN